MRTITVIDPVTRIEGHLKVEIEIESVGGAPEIVDARCTGTLFRGFEIILQGRDPWDAPVLTQRICGVCPISHAQASVLALEKIGNWLPTRNGRLLRNLTLGANFVQSHILHFYLLAALDYVSGPNGSPWTPAFNVDIRGGLDHVAGHLGLAIEARRRAHEMGAVFGGRMPTSHTYLPGGFSAGGTAARIRSFRVHLNHLLNFIENTYLPDVEAVGSVYADYFRKGEGCQNLLAYGVFETSDSGPEKLLSPGYAEDASRSVQSGVPVDSITESVACSWYNDPPMNLSPRSGETDPIYPKEGAYSWLKAPRLFDRPFEVGPLARMWINGDYQDGISIMDRHVARARETLKVARAMENWLDELDGGHHYDNSYVQQSGFGIGMTEAPRGALGHWVQTQGRRIEHYQVVTPTCWNCSPRDNLGIPGPVEQALIGMRIEDADCPIEALRVIHSFDPCLSCAVHVMRPNGRPLVAYAGVGVAKRT